MAFPASPSVAARHIPTSSTPGSDPGPAQDRMDDGPSSSKQRVDYGPAQCSCQCSQGKCSISAGDRCSGSGRRSDEVPRAALARRKSATDRLARWTSLNLAVMLPNEKQRPTSPTSRCPSCLFGAVLLVPRAVVLDARPRPHYAPVSWPSNAGRGRQVRQDPQHALAAPDRKLRSLGPRASYVPRRDAIAVNLCDADRRQRLRPPFEHRCAAARVPVCANCRSDGCAARLARLSSVAGVSGMWSGDARSSRIAAVGLLWHRRFAP